MTPTAAPPAPRRLSTLDVCELAGVTYRVLDYWLRLGLFHMPRRTATPGSGRRREWSPVDVLAALAAGRLAKLDVPTTALARATDLVYASDGIPPGAGWLVVEAAGGAWFQYADGHVDAPAWVIPVADLADLVE